MRVRIIVTSLLSGIVLFVSSNLGAQTNPIVEVAFDHLMAGQFNVGYEGVNRYTLPPLEQLYLTGWYGNEYYGPGPDGLKEFERNRPAPAILGPFSNGVDPIYHLLDNHHRTTALYRLSTIYTNSMTVTVTNNVGEVITTNIGAAPSSVFVKQTLDWSTMPTNLFWSSMQAGNTGGVTNFAPVEGGLFAASTNQPNYVWNYNLGQQVDLNLTPPPFIPGLTDDTLRGIGGTIARAQSNEFGAAPAGYLERDSVGDVLYYQEFYWANYLRPLVFWDTAGTTNVAFGMDSSAPNRFTNYDELTIFAANLARDPSAANLPGYLGVPEPSTVLLFALGGVVAFCMVLRKKFHC